MDLEELRAFLHVVESGSFLAAAERLQVSRTTLRRRVDSLEARAGVPLLESTQQGIVLTDAGRVLSRRGRLLDEEADALLASIRETGQEPAGVLRVSFPVGLPPQMIASLFGALRAAHPRLHVACRFSDDPLTDSLVGVDMAVHFSDTTPKGKWLSYVILRLQEQLIAGKDYLARRGTPTSLDDLAHHELFAWQPPRRRRARLAPAPRRRLHRRSHPRLLRHPPRPPLLPRRPWHRPRPRRHAPRSRLCGRRAGPRAPGARGARARFAGDGARGAVGDTEDQDGAGPRPGDAGRDMKNGMRDQPDDERKRKSEPAAGVPMRTLDFARAAGILVLVHTREPPAQAEWDGYLDAVIDVGRARPEMALLVVTEGGAPDAAQRAQLAEAYGDTPTLTAVCNHSSVVQCVITAVGWITRARVRGFGYDDLAAAVAYLRLDPSDLPEITAQIQKLQRSLGARVVKGYESVTHSDAPR